MITAYYPLIVSEKCYLPIIQLLARLPQVKSLCEIGGGANPLLEHDFILQNQLEYTILDISQEELDKAPDCYHKICADITSDDLHFTQQFDLVFSRMVAEHIKPAENFHKNVFQMLSEKGIAFHFFPTLYSLPFFVNKIIPDSLAQGLLDFFAPRDKFQNAKFRAYYDWCFGPTKENIQRFNGVGYQILQYIGFFGHGYYEGYNPMDWMHRQKTSLLLQSPNPYLTSYVYLLLAKSKTETVLDGNEIKLLKFCSRISRRRSGLV